MTDRLDEVEAREATRNWPPGEMPVEFADLRWLIAEVRVWRDRALTAETQRQAVLDLCDQADQRSDYRSVVHTAQVRAALGATGTETEG